MKKIGIVLAVLATALLFLAVFYVGTATATDDVTSEVCTETVVITEAYDKTIPGTDPQRYSYNPPRGAPAPTTPPPGDVWNPDNATYNEGTAPAGTGVIYQQGQGNGSFFYWTPGTEAQVIHHDAVTEEVEVPCPTETTTTVTDPPETTTTSVTEVPSTTSEAPTTTTTTSEVPSTTGTNGGPGSPTDEAPNPKPDQDGPKKLAFTGIEDVVPIGAAALALLTVGSGLMWAGRRKENA